MKIRRYADIRSTNLYELEINDEYVASINDSIKQRYVEDPNWKDLTKESLYEAYVDEYSDIGSYELTITYGLNRDMSYKTTVHEYVRDCIEEDLWDNYIDTIGSETYDWEDEVEN